MIRATVTFKNRRPEVQMAIVNQIGQAVEKAAAIMERNMKVEATTSFKQRTGNLRRSIRFRKISATEAEVGINPVREGADVNYAKFLEYGTRFIVARAFIRKGANRSIPAINKIFKDVLKKLR